MAMQSVPITIKVGEFKSRSIQHYVIKFVGDLQQGVGFLLVIWFPPPLKLTAMV
jgi:hypothetical protein